MKIILSAQPEREVTVAVTATLLDGAFHVGLFRAPADVVFGQNDTEKSLTLSTTDDTVDDDGEKVRLGFTMLPALVNAGTPTKPPCR